jgi:hypothetical protein
MSATRSSIPRHWPSGRLPTSFRARLVSERFLVDHEAAANPGNEVESDSGRTDGGATGLSVAPRGLSSSILGVH